MSFDIPNSPYEVPEDGKVKINEQNKLQQQKKQQLIESHYDMNQSYEQPMAGFNLHAPNPLNDDYEIPEDPEMVRLESEKRGVAFRNPMYNTGPNTVPMTHNYEMMEDDSHPVPINNSLYDIAPDTVPPTDNYDTIDEDALINDTYDSTVIPTTRPSNAGIINDTYDTTPGTVPQTDNYETIDEENMGIMNDTYDSTAFSSNTAGIINDTYDTTPGTVPPTDNYETIDEENMGIMNDTYDSTTGMYQPLSSSGPSLVNPVYDSRIGNKDRFTGMNNATYDSRVSMKSQQPSIGLVNAAYDSRAGVFAKDKLPVVNDAEMNDVPSTDNYEFIEDPDTNNNGGNGMVPPNDNYEEIDSNDVPINNSFVNRMYDSRANIKNGLSVDRNASPYEVPNTITNSDYELPNDGHPDINIYDAPHS